MASPIRRKVAGWHRLSGWQAGSRSAATLRALGMIERLKVKVLYGAYRRQPIYVMRGDPDETLGAGTAFRSVAAYVACCKQQGHPRVHSYLVPAPATLCDFTAINDCARGRLFF